MSCYSAIRIFESLNAAERRELCQFMQRNRTLTVATALLALYEVFYISEGTLFIGVPTTRRF